MTSVFVDTSALYALLVRTDRMHAPAKDWLKQLETESAKLTSSSFVVHETVALLQARVGIQGVRDFQSAVLPMLDLVWIDAETYERSMAALLAADARGISLTDWSNMEIMRSRHMERIFAFDPDYGHRGFKVEPPSP